MKGRTKGYTITAKLNDRSYTELILWVNAREWHASYTSHRRPRLLVCGDRYGSIHPQFIL